MPILEHSHCSVGKDFMRGKDVKTREVMKTGKNLLVKASEESDLGYAGQRKR